jgi:hypothetical protein
MMPDGLEHVSSWISEDMKRCYQLMRTDDAALFQTWTNNWADLVDFEIIPVPTSVEVARLMEQSES